MANSLSKRDRIGRIVLVIVLIVGLGCPLWAWHRSDLWRWLLLPIVVGLLARRTFRLHDHRRAQERAMAESRAQGAALKVQLEADRASDARELRDGGAA